MKKIGVSLVLLFIIVFCFSSIGLAHGGRTDSEGGHRDNNNVSGLGSYHYHHGYEAHLHEDGVCPYEFDNAEKPSSSSADTSVNTSSQGFAQRDDVFVYDSKENISDTDENTDIEFLSTSKNTTKDSNEFTDTTILDNSDETAEDQENSIGFFDIYLIKISNFWITVIIAAVIVIIILIGVAVSKTTRKKIERLYAEKEEELRKTHAKIIENLQTEIFEREMALQDKEADFRAETVRHNEILNSKKQTYPWLAKLFADYEYTQDLDKAHKLRTKYRPAPRAAEEVARIAESKRKLQQRCKMCEYQIRYYEALFPGLKIYKTGNPIKMWDKIKNLSDEEKESLHNMTDEEKYQFISKWNEER